MTVAAAFAFDPAGDEVWTAVELVPCTMAPVPSPAAPLLERRFEAPRADSWRPEEIARLRSLFGADAPLREIVADLGRPLHGVRTKICDLGLRRNSALPWTEEDDAELTRRYGLEPTAAVAADLGRTAAAVYARACILGLTRGVEPDWCAWEIAQIRAGYPAGVPPLAMARMIGRTLSAVLTKANDLGLRSPNARERWSPDEVAILAEGVEQDLTARRIAARLAEHGFARSRTAVKIRLQALGYERMTALPFSADEDEVIRRGYAAADTTDAIAARLVGRSGGAVARRARLLALRHPRARAEAWTPGQHARLRQGYADREAPRLIAAAVGKSLRATYAEAHRLGIDGTHRAKFTPEQDAILLSVDAADGPTLKEAAARIGRDYGTCSQRRTRLRKIAARLAAGEPVRGAGRRIRPVPRDAAPQTG
jgi:hypothetical protein